MLNLILLLTIVVIVGLAAWLIGILAGQLARLQRAAVILYLAGYWKAEGVSAHDAALMWERLRDAAGLRPGLATEYGVGDPYQKEL